jgi:hypothetical protein
MTFQKGGVTVSLECCRVTAQQRILHQMLSQLQQTQSPTVPAGLPATAYTWIHSFSVQCACEHASNSKLSADVMPHHRQVERPGELQEVVGAKRLSDNVSSILERLEGELDKVDSRIGESMHVLDLDNDGLVRLRVCCSSDDHLQHHGME